MRMKRPFNAGASLDVRARNLADLPDDGLRGFAADLAAEYEDADAHNDLDRMAELAHIGDQLKAELQRRGADVEPAAFWSMPGPAQQPRVGLTAAAMRTRIAERTYGGRLSDLPSMEPRALVALRGDIGTAFDAADRRDDTHGMQRAIDAQDAVLAEYARRGMPLTAAAGPIGAGPSAVVAGPGVWEPGWVSLMPPPPVDPATGKPVRRSPEEAARLVKAAQDADARLTAQADAAGLAAAYVPVDAIVWLPFEWLVAAAEANPEAPAWAVTTWCLALIGPARTIGPLLPDEQYSVMRLAGQINDWRVVWHLCEQLAAGRPNPTPNPRLAERAPFRSPETAWVAHTGGADPLESNGLWQALMLLLGDRNDTARVRENQLVGSDPITRLAALILGPAATQRVITGAAVDQRLHAYGEGSPMDRAARMLRKGAPAPADRSVLDTLSPEQRQALATLVTEAAPTT